MRRGAPEPKAKDVMQGDVHVVAPGLPLDRLEELFLSRRVSGFPVVEGGRLVGVVTRSDVVRRLAVERSYAGYVSDFYSAGDPFEAREEPRSFEAMAAEVGVRLAELTVADVMSENALSVGPEQPLAELARLLLEHRIHRVPVVDGEKLVGIVSSLDLVRLFAEGRVRATR